MKTRSEIEALAAIVYPYKEHTSPMNRLFNLVNVNKQREQWVAGYTACQDEDRWISVSEGKPNEGQQVQCYQPHSLIYCRYLTLVFSNGLFVDLNEDGVPEKELDGYYPAITHWRELPNPPKV